MPRDARRYYHEEEAARLLFSHMAAADIGIASADGRYSSGHEVDAVSHYCRAFCCMLYYSCYFHDVLYFWLANINCM